MQANFENSKGSEVSSEEKIEINTKRSGKKMRGGDS